MTIYILARKILELLIRLWRIQKKNQPLDKLVLLFWISLPYLKIGLKVTFHFADPEEIFWENSFCLVVHFYHKSLFPCKYSYL